jgi:SAM-dependent MidA family methyltransferase
MTLLSEVPDAFRSVFEAAAGADGILPFDRFMALALYDLEVGYYRSKRHRIGFGEGSDFFTSTTSDPVFGELIAAACTTLLGTRPIDEYTFVEIGAESAGGVLEHVAHPFKAVRTCRIGDALVLSGKCIVFSNELFDAQPFRRFVTRAGVWQELGVQLISGSLHEVELSTTPPPQLPAGLPDGYVIDAPFAAAALAKDIAAQHWNGLFVACDYGKSWRELTEACPAGTARAYFRHTQSNELLARPTQQDLTCHVCWDWIVHELEAQGFAKPRVDSQESFFIRHATDYIAITSAAEAAKFSRRKASLSQLLHPAHLGQKFQVLHALRDESHR